MKEKEVLLTFESEDAEGIVAVGSYLIDAAKRMGIAIDCDCSDETVETQGSCAVRVSAGGTLLSAPTALEKELEGSGQLKKGERLACQTKFEKPGEVTIMSIKEKEVEEEKKDKKEETREEFKKQFEELPLEKKIANLMELEAIALGETFSFVLNSPYAAAGKIMDVLAGYGFKMEKEEQEAKRPAEHVRNEEAEEPAAEKAADEKTSTATGAEKKASKSAKAGGPGKSPKAGKSDGGKKPKDGKEQDE